jgi:hypothetical protein
MRKSLKDVENDSHRVLVGMKGEFALKTVLGDLRVHATTGKG